MIGILIVAHNEYAKALIDTSKMIYGEVENIEAVSFVHGEGLEILKNKILDKIKTINTSDGCIVLLDVFGGTPMNASVMALGEREDVSFVYGTNISMLLEVLSRRESVGIRELTEIAINAGKESIGSVKNLKK